MRGAGMLFVTRHRSFSHIILVLRACRAPGARAKTVRSNEKGNGHVPGKACRGAHCRSGRRRLRSEGARWRCRGRLCLRTRSLQGLPHGRAEESSPRRFEIGPAFRDVANTPGMTATALRVFLTSSHPKMPNLILKPEEIADVTAYILNLRDHR